MWPLPPPTSMTRRSAEVWFCWNHVQKSMFPGSRAVCPSYFYRPWN
jgi:hypothetical protein